MQDKILSNAASELAEIFKYLEEDVLNKIPKEVISKIEKRKNSDYVFKLDKNKDLKQQELMEETKQILSAIFLKYCCTEVEAQEILDKHDMLEKNKEDGKIGLEQLQDVFNSNMSKVDLDSAQNEIITVDKISWHAKFINKIKAFFKINK